VDLELATTHGWITDELAKAHGIGETMQRLIKRCNAVCPHPDWEELARLPYDDVADLEAWLSRLIQASPPHKPLAGLWFGLFNPVYDRVAVSDIYVCGSNRFDPGDCEWAVGPGWWPEGRYAHSKILAEIYTIAYRKDGLANSAEYPLCLAYSAAAVRELLNSPKIQSHTRSWGSPGVTVGFDSGDFVLLGRLTENGKLQIA
jgi:hypothetical protein